MEDLIIGTDSNASGITMEFPAQDGLLYSTVEVDTIPPDEEMYLSVDFQVVLFFVLGIIIGILLINRRFS